MNEKLVLLSKKYIPSFDTVDKIIEGYDIRSKVVKEVAGKMVRDVLDEEILRTTPIYFHHFYCGEWRNPLTSRAFDIGGAVFKVAGVMFTLNRLFGPNQKPVYDIIVGDSLEEEIEGDVIKKKIKREG